MILTLTQNRLARLAGLTYLGLIITGVFSLMYIPNQLIDWDNAAKTMENIKGNLVLFKLSIVSGLLMALSFLMLAIVLYKLFVKVSATSAALLVLFVAISVCLSFSDMVHRMDVLTLLTKPAYLNQQNLQTQIMLHLESYRNGIHVNSVFWGLWLFPFGYLVFKSGFLPKVLGIFLMLGCFGYLVEFVGNLFMEDYYISLLSDIANLPSQIGEFGICLWLVIMGSNSFRLSRSKQ